MITRAQAQALRQQYINSFPSRVDAAITQAATFGGQSVTISYAPVADAVAQAFVTAAIATPNLWQGSTIDTVNKTITIAP